MSQPQIEIILIASIVAANAALIGSFLVLRRMALMSDAISHAILLGIVLIFFVVESLASLPMLLAATLTGLLTVTLVEAITRTRLVREDAAIGLVFPALFSIGVILVSRYAANVHLDTDAVLLGELAFAPFQRMVLGGYDLGPSALWLAGAVGVLNLGFVGLFYKELKLATFDAELAAALGFAPAAIHYALMTLVSVTAVSSFEAVGSVLVVALMIVPPAAALLLTDRLPIMLGLSVLIGVVSAVTGNLVAHALDASIAGSIATMAGVWFALVLLLAPHRGLVARAIQRRQRRLDFAQTMLAIHLLHHEGGPEAASENRVEHLDRHLRWDPQFASRVVTRAERSGLVVADRGALALTEEGRTIARQAMAR